MFKRKRYLSVCVGDKLEETCKIARESLLRHRVHISIIMLQRQGTDILRLDRNYYYCYQRITIS